MLLIATFFQDELLKPSSFEKAACPAQHAAGRVLLLSVRPKKGKEVNTGKMPCHC